MHMRHHQVTHASANVKIIEKEDHELSLCADPSA